jgi:hypothetical protein
MLFKRTAHQSVGVIRFGFGVSGAALGGAFGLFLVMVCAVAIRLLGSVAQSEVANARAEVPPSRLTSGLAHMKHSIESGTTGAVMDKVDPVPDAVYSTLNMVGQIASSTESLERFAENPGIRPLQNHPKIIALRDDPEIAKAVREQNFMGLLRNPRLVAAANDPEVLKILSGVDIQKALSDAAEAAEPEETPGWWRGTLREGGALDGRGLDEHPKVKACDRYPSGVRFITRSGTFLGFPSMRKAYLE